MFLFHPIMNIPLCIAIAGAVCAFASFISRSLAFTDEYGKPLPDSNFFARHAYAIMCISALVSVVALLMTLASIGAEYEETASSWVVVEAHELVPSPQDAYLEYSSDGYSLTYYVADGGGARVECCEIRDAAIYESAENETPRVERGYVETRLIRRSIKPSWWPFAYTPIEDELINTDSTTWRFYVPGGVQGIES